MDNKKKPRLVVKDHEKDKVYLFIFPGNNIFGPSPSPPCLKLETYLNIAKIPYEVPTGMQLQKSPKGKLPFIELNGEPIADSELIIQRLEDQFGSIDDHLDALQKATSVAFIRMLDEHLYWCLAYFRWVYPEGERATASLMEQTVPFGVRTIAFKYVQRNFKSQLYGQGLGRHSEKDLLYFAEKDIDALAALLGDKQFVFGDKPARLDCSFYGILYNILRPTYESPLKELVAKHDNLVAYCKRITDLYYTDKPFAGEPTTKKE